MSDDEYPEYSETEEMGERGRWIVEGTVRDSLRWLFREIQKSDLGIDGFVEILDDNRKTHGHLFAVQLKTGPSYFKEPNKEGFLFRGKRKHHKYWLEFSLPVLVVLCDPDTQTKLLAARLHRARDAKGQGLDHYDPTITNAGTGA